ncbi:enolase-phosphatase E1 [Oleoguttula sp. CCFEE 5521]
MDRIKCIILDIEGTICPISFVKERLFPYALDVLPYVLELRWNDPTFASYRDAFPEEHRSSPQALRAHVVDLTKQDVKIAYLKNLQGYLCADGYRNGNISAPLFDDVVPQLRSWKDDGKILAIYSSGSVPAQKLLMEHVKVTAEDGSDGGKVQDLRGLISGWFDTVNAGPKNDEESYVKIAKALKVGPDACTFCTDNVSEAIAAQKAGMSTVLVRRPGNEPLETRAMQAFKVVDDIRL